jgi:hypothetical protein
LTRYRLEISRPTSSFLPSGPSETFSGSAGQMAGFAANGPVTLACEAGAEPCSATYASPLAGVSIPLEVRRPCPLRAPVSRCPTLASARTLRWPRAHVLTRSHCIALSGVSAVATAEIPAAASSSGGSRCAVMAWRPRRTGGVGGRRAEARLPHAAACRITCAKWPRAAASSGERRRAAASGSGERQRRWREG